MLLTILLVCSLLLILFGAVILSGKGDNLIAGYNTAALEEQQKFHLKRIRLLVSLFLFGNAVILPLLDLMSERGIIFCTLFLLLFSVLTVVLANSWGKK